MEGFSTMETSTTSDSESEETTMMSSPVCVAEDPRARDDLGDATRRPPFALPDGALGIEGFLRINSQSIMPVLGVAAAHLSSEKGQCGQCA